jgi:DNA mismatch endonuclease (patch repair protein)
VFVDGCFWHACPRCFRMPATNRDYWEVKISRNVSRDRRITRGLRAKGWKVVRVWEHSLSRPDAVAARIGRALDRD